MAATLNFSVQAPSEHSMLRTQVYQYLRAELVSGNLKPGAFLSMNALMKELNLSRTPLRDALLQLQSEGFVSFLPQRGIKVVELDQQDIENLYEILGALESRVYVSTAPSITPDHVKQMREINRQMADNMSDEQIYIYADLNVAFHKVYISLSPNLPLRNLIENVRQRLFVFGKKDWSPEMRKLNHSEHMEFMELIETGTPVETADYLRDVHCNYQILKDAENRQPNGGR